MEPVYQTLISAFISLFFGVCTLVLGLRVYKRDTQKINDEHKRNLDKDLDDRFEKKADVTWVKDQLNSAKENTQTQYNSIQDQLSTIIQMLKK